MLCLAEQAQFSAAEPLGAGGTLLWNSRPGGRGRVLEEVVAYEARTGQWGQGATWSDDGRTILQQGAIDKTIEVYRFDGKSLTRDTAATIQLDSRPGSIATAASR